MTESAPVASLPMYDWPEVAGANDILWKAVAENLRGAGLAVPDSLERARSSEDVWADPGLVLSQTCGWPYATRLHPDVLIVGTPIYSVPGCDGPYYSSAFIARDDERAASVADLAGRRFAFNGLDSLSGYVAPLRHLATEGVGAADFEWIETGSHRASIAAVASGAADVAAIDAVCWAMSATHDGQLAGRLRVLDWTAKRPSLPWIASRRLAGAEPVIRSAIADALAAPETAAARAALHLDGFAVLGEAAYHDLRDEPGGH